eukprot:1107406-Prymnesium_polylepis.1
MCRHVGVAAQHVGRRDAVPSERAPVLARLGHPAGDLVGAKDQQQADRGALQREGGERHADRSAQLLVHPPDDQGVEHEHDERHPDARQHRRVVPPPTVLPVAPGRCVHAPLFVRPQLHQRARKRRDHVGGQGVVLGVGRGGRHILGEGAEGGRHRHRRRIVVEVVVVVVVAAWRPYDRLEAASGGVLAHAARGVHGVRLRRFERMDGWAQSSQ